MANPRYVDDPFEEEQNNSSISRKAREGKTPLQKQALVATGRTHFKDKKEHEAFKSFEALAAGADPESRIWAAWILDRIGVAIHYNKRGIAMTMPKLLAAIGNKVKRDNWFIDNREAVLRKPTAKELASTLTGTQAGVDDMEKRMKARSSELEE